jgi:hypothetical protein
MNDFFSWVGVTIIIGAVGAVVLSFVAIIVSVAVLALRHAFGGC